MVDVLEQSGANRPKAGAIVTPTATVSPQEMVRPQLETADGLRSLGQALGTLGEQIDHAKVPEAQAAGLAAVGRDENGQPTVELRPFALSASDRAFNAAATQGLISKSMEDAARGLQEIAAEFPLDPQGFEAKAKTFVNGLGAGSKELRPLVQQEGQKLLQQHFLSITNKKVAQTTANAKDSLLVQIDTTSNEIYALARQGGTNTDEYRTASARLAGFYEQLAGNPIYGVAPDRAAAEVRSTRDRAKSFAMSSEAVRVYDAQGEKAAQKWLIANIRDNPDLKIDDGQRNSLLEVGRNAIAMRKGENKAQVDANKGSAAVMLKAMEAGKSLPIGDINNAVDTATRLGDSETAAKLITARQIYARSDFSKGLSDEERVRAATSVGAVPSDVHGVITQAADRYGISHNYALRVAHIESRFDPNAINGGSKATGLFQFIPSTWRSYGAGQNPRDPAANADAAARLTIANRNQLRASIGREPTEGELYLAHQQGAGGAAQLLSNPDARAVDVVGERAVLGNGGTLNMTAGQFAQLWIRKFDGASSTAPAAPAGAGRQMPFTQQQMAANPYLAPTWLKAQLNGNKELIDSAKYVMSAASNAIDKGNLPDAQTLAGAIQIANQNPAQLGRDRDLLVAKISGYGDGEAAGNLPAGAGARLVADVMQRAQGAPIFVQAQAEAMKAAFERGAKALKDDPWNEAVRRGWAKEAPPPLVIGNPDSMAGGFAMRADIARGIAARTGEPGRSALSPADVSEISNAWNYGGGDQQGRILAAIGQLPDEQIEPTLRALGEDKATQQLAFVAGLFREAPDAALTIVRGRAALAANPGLAPKPEQWRDTDLQKALPMSVAAPERSGIRSSISEAARSVYASLSQRDGDESGVLNTDRMNEAVQVVTGGLVEHNGSKLIPPTRGMTQDQFDKVLWSLGDQDFAAAATKSGLRVTAQDVRRNFVLRGVADGRYALQARNSPAEWLYQPPVLGRDIDNTSGGYQGEQRFILDLKGRQPAAQAFVPGAVIFPFPPGGL